MLKELAEFTRIMNALEKAHLNIPAKAATLAVNFSKERFRQQNWVGDRTQPWKKRKENKRDKRKGRAILVDKANLKRDVHKIWVRPNAALVGTSKLTAKYAQAHNEGFKGTVKVPAYKRHSYIKVKEQYKTRNGTTRNRTRKTLSGKAPGLVKAHTRKINLVKRQFLGASPVLDNQIQRMITAEYTKAIRNA